MSEYTEAVESNLSGLEAVSTGVCPGCSECRSEYDYVPDDGDGYWRVRARPDAGVWLTEAGADKAAWKLFADNWGSGRLIDEPHFSWGSCGICGSHLGGDREVWHAIDAHGEILHFDDACVDCVVYLANGDEPEVWEHD